MAPPVPAAPPPPPVPPAAWPPPWARTAAFFGGMALMAFEAIIEHSAHLIAYGLGFALTGLPLVKGLEQLLQFLGGLVGGKK